MQFCLHCCFFKLSIIWQHLFLFKNIAITKFKCCHTLSQNKMDIKTDFKKIIIKYHCQLQHSPVNA